VRTALLRYFEENAELGFLDDAVIGDAKLPDQLPPDIWLFCHPDGKRIKSFENGFDKVVSDVGLLHHDGRKRSLTSIRHSYASRE
jgi:hypothetical protein